jgi:hypothetical protein
MYETGTMISQGFEAWGLSDFRDSQAAEFLRFANDSPKDSHLVGKFIVIPPAVEALSSSRWLSGSADNPNGEIAPSQSRQGVS